MLADEEMPCTLRVQKTMQVSSTCVSAVDERHTDGATRPGSDDPRLLAEQPFKVRVGAAGGASQLDAAADGRAGTGGSSERVCGRTCRGLHAPAVTAA